jgi:hypothetical protein
MSEGEITPKSEISKLLGAKPVLPGENAKVIKFLEYHR